MNRRQAEQQIRIVLVTYRAEKQRHDDLSMLRFRDRAEAILDQLEPRIRDDRELLKLLRSTRRELRRGVASARGRFGQQSVDGRGQFGDRERLH